MTKNERLERGPKIEGKASTENERLERAEVHLKEVFKLRACARTRLLSRGAGVACRPVSSVGVSEREAVRASPSAFEAGGIAGGADALGCEEEEDREISISEHFLASEI